MYNKGLISIPNKLIQAYASVKVGDDKKIWKSIVNPMLPIMLISWMHSIHQGWEDQSYNFWTHFTAALHILVIPFAPIINIYSF